jgi:delta 1-pyrroline-5-carboxylate dehydrogenase
MQVLEETCQSFISGNYQRRQEEGRVEPNYHPASNQIINHVVYATQSELDHALQSCRQAGKLWQRLSVHERGAILMKAAAGCAGIFCQSGSCARRFCDTASQGAHLYHA